MEDKRFRGKVAIITASTEGIGFGIAKRLAENGAKVIISSRTEEKVTNAVQQLKDLNLTAYGIVCDVGKGDDREKLIETAINEYGQLDILVSNAGISAKPLLDTTEEEWDHIFNINVKSGFLLAKACVPHLTKTKGSMLFIGSQAGYQTMGVIGTYSVSKTALIGLVKTLSHECAPYNIRVNGISPGGIVTKMAEWFMNEKELYNASLQTIPMRRFGTVEEIAGGALFLLSEDASYITGEMMLMNGGMNTRL